MKPMVMPEALNLIGEIAADVRARLVAGVQITGDFRGDLERHSAFWQAADCLRTMLPRKPKRSATEQSVAETLLEAARAARERFLAVHALRVYDELTATRSRFVRIDELLSNAAEVFSGLVPSAAALAVEARAALADKDGIEIDQGIFLSHVLANAPAGLHLCHAMLLPRAESVALAETYQRAGELDIGSVHLRCRDRVVHLTASNPQYLNAEDETTLGDMEYAVDVAILCPSSRVATFRGGTLHAGKYAGRRVLGAGINLTRLYHGKIPFLWFMNREMGYLHKILRGLAEPSILPDDMHGGGIEKPWVAAVDAFAIGGHCQILLCMDYVVATRGAKLSLPARKEGIIPGVANLRLERFVGPRLARQAIQYGLEIPCDSPAGRDICDEVVLEAELEIALDRVSASIAHSGAQSVSTNRRALRVGGEPLDIFRQYCATYAREQAYCCFGTDLVANLEHHWNARSRRI
jgi:thioesterase DpgC